MDLNGGNLTDAKHELRARELRQRFLETMAEEISKSANADVILATTTRMLGEFLGLSSCAYADMDLDQDGFTIRGDWAAPGAMHITGHYSLADFGKKAVSELAAGRPLIIADNLRELESEESAAFQAIGIGATICMPLVIEGRLTALMAVHHRGPHAWSPEELALVREVTDRSWAHIARVRAGQLAAQADERLRLATKASGIGTWDYDPTSGELRWNERCKALFGLPSDAAISYEGSFLAGLHPDDRDRADTAVARALNADGPEPFNIEYRTVGIIDGIERWISATGEALFEAGRAVRFVGTVLDITARKKAEEHLRVLNDTGAVVARELDLETVVQIVTDAGVVLSGAEFGAFFYNVLDDSGASYMLYALSGVPRSAFANFPMPRATAVFEPTFLGTGVVRSDDILKDPLYGQNTPRQGMPDGHLPVRSYLAVPVVSRSAEVLGGLFFGHSEPGRFLLEHETALLGIAGHAATAIDNARLFQAANREIEQRRKAEAELQTLNRDLESRVASEILERLKTEEQLRQAQKMEAVGQLTGGIAHDFNNMLAVVIGGLDLAQRKLQKGDTNIGRFVESAVEAARRAATLTQRLLAFSRQQPLAPETLNLNRLVRNMSEMLDRALGETVMVETVLAAGLWQVRADPTQLESALLNLSVNARDAMPRGGKLTIETMNASVDDKYAGDYGLRPGQYVLVAVTDTGIGMDMDTAAKAFDPFFTTKGVGKGTGLGLSQVYGFVRQSGGHVKIHSELGVGTTIKIYLPRYVGDVETSEPTTPGLVDDDQNRELILVVEDDDRVRAISCEALSDLGYRILEAATPGQALKMIKDGAHPDLLFSDVVMPEMSGRELATTLQALQPGLKVLFTTGYTRNAIVHNGVLDAGTHLLSKPFAISDLARKVREILDEM